MRRDKNDIYLTKGNNRANYMQPTTVTDKKNEVTHEGGRSACLERGGSKIEKRSEDQLPRKPSSNASPSTGVAAGG